MTFGADHVARTARGDAGGAHERPAGNSLEAKARRLHDRISQREIHFRRSVMSDSPMGVMLPLFQGELASVTLSESNIALTNMLEASEARRIIESLIQAGLIVVTGETPERRTVGLTPLGSARMRSYISDHPDI